MLTTKALVLNRNWIPIHVTPVRTALSLAYRGIARIISPDTYETHTFDSWADLRAQDGEACIRTVSLRIRIPEVIVLQGYDKMPQMKVPFTRKNIYRRDGYTCQYCGSKPGSRELSIDHIVPRSRGGKSTWTNCVLACTTCNSVKANRSLEESGRHLLKTPEKPKWYPYITIPLMERKQSWERFISDRYWDVTLEE